MEKTAEPVVSVDVAGPGSAPQMPSSRNREVQEGVALFDGDVGV